MAEGRGDQTMPSISGDRVVWMDDSGRDWDIRLHDLNEGSTRSVASGRGQQMHPVISGNTVVWEDDRNGDWDIYAYDLATGEEMRLTGEGDQVCPHISSEFIVWEDQSSGDICRYSLGWKRAIPFVRDGDQRRPKVHGKYVVYQEKTAEGWSIYRFDPGSWKVEQVAEGTGEIELDFDQKLVWMRSPSGKFGYLNLASDQTSIICEAPGNQTCAAVSGDWVVWMDNRTDTPDVYIYNLVENLEWPLAAGPDQDMYPDIKNDIVVWTHYVPNLESWTLFTFDIPAVNRSWLEGGGGLSVASPPSVSEEILAWEDHTSRWTVRKRPLYTSESMEVIPPWGAEPMNPNAGGSIVVYQYYDKAKGEWDIYMWKGREIKVPVFTGPKDQINPATDGRLIVWQDRQNGSWDIRAYDLGTGKVSQKTSSEGDEINPDVDGDLLVWQDNRGGDWDIRALDLTSGEVIEICSDPGNQTDPRVGGDKIVWVDDRRGDKDIRLYERYST